jgi:hypothetical protein
MAQEPYRSARRMLWIVDGGKIRRGQRARQRLEARFPNLVLVSLPTHASWLNQIDIYFSIFTMNRSPSRSRGRSRGATSIAS